MATGMSDYASLLGATLGEAAAANRDSMAAHAFNAVFGSIPDGKTKEPETLQSAIDRCVRECK